MSAIGGPMALQIPTITIDDLREFHAKHFPHAPLPEHFFQGAEPQAEEEEYYGEEDDGLGYYPDGVKRTLTDEQIALFRHTEIQTILRERRRKREAEEDAKEEADARRTEAGIEAEASATAPAPELPPVPTEAASDTTSAVTRPDNLVQVCDEPMVMDESAPMDVSDTSDSTPVPVTVGLPPKNDVLNKIQDGRVGKQQQWKASSGKTQKKNRTNRKAYFKKRAQDRKRRREGSVTTGKTGDDEESDEWDPWHQANGPDVQKDTTVDLDY